MSSCKIWNGRKNHQGFPIKQTTERRDGKQRTVRLLLHVILWEEKNGPVQEGRVLGHTCGNPACINLEHLQVMSEQESEGLYACKSGLSPRKHWAAKLTEQDVRDILELAAAGESPFAIAHAYAVSPGAITSILKGLTWKHVSLDGKPRINEAALAQEKFRTPECIRYDGSVAANGFGRYSKNVDGKLKIIFAHHDAWQAAYGPVPKGYNVVHYCNYRACVNPAHLRLVTKQQSAHLTKFPENRQARLRGEKHANSKLTADDVQHIKALLKDGEKKASIARAFGVTQAAIAGIESGRLWRHSDELDEDLSNGTDDDQEMDLQARQRYLDSIAPLSGTTMGRRFTSEVLVLGGIYSRQSLMEQFDLFPTYSLKNQVVVQPDSSRFRSVWFFLTGSRTDTEQAIMPDEDTVRVLKQKQTDPLIQLSSKGAEICLFYRNWRNEHGNVAAFQYRGTFEFLEIETADETNYLKLRRCYDALFDTAKRDIEAFEAEHAERVHAEGTKYRVLGSRYERDPAARAAAIRFHGTQCVACGFSFLHTYGSHGENFVEVHHHRPLSEYEERQVVDPKEDMTVLCSNCHSMVHRNPQEPLTLDELKGLIWQNRHGTTGNCGSADGS